MDRKMTSTDKRQRLLEGQVLILKLIAKDKPVEDTLAALTGMVEELEPDAVAGVTIVDRAERTLEMAVFPPVPRASSLIQLPVCRWGRRGTPEYDEMMTKRAQEAARPKAEQQQPK
jgi:hypothetical protein